MTPGEIDKKLAEAAFTLPDRTAEQAAAARARAAILRDLQPIAPLPPSSLYTLVLVLLATAVASVSAAFLGMAGLHALGLTQRLAIFAVLLAAACLAALACARHMRPAAGRNLSPMAGISATALPAAAVVLLFNGYGFDGFFGGVQCLQAGLYVAIPAAFAIHFLVRHGFTVDRASAGLATGTLSGLAGFGMLELHCPNLQALHIVVWHVAVVIVAGALGYCFGLFDSND